MPARSCQSSNPWTISSRGSDGQSGFVLIEGPIMHSYFTFARLPGTLCHYFSLFVEWMDGMGCLSVWLIESSSLPFFFVRRSLYCFCWTPGSFHPSHFHRRVCSAFFSFALVLSLSPRLPVPLSFFFFFLSLLSSLSLTPFSNGWVVRAAILALALALCDTKAWRGQRYRDTFYTNHHFSLSLFVLPPTPTPLLPLPNSHQHTSSPYNPRPSLLPHTTNTFLSCFNLISVLCLHNPSSSAPWSSMR